MIRFSYACLILIDTTAPVFDSCPSEPWIFSIGQNGPEPVNFVVPTASDNSGQVPSIVSSPANVVSPYKFTGVNTHV